MRGPSGAEIGVLRLFDFLFPSRCPSCGLGSDSLALAPFCRSCWADISPYDGPSCGICAQPLASKHAITCGDCIEKRPRFEKAISFGLYEGVLKDAVMTLKFSKARRLARPLGRLISSLDIPEADAVVAVPLTRRALLERGYNQSMLLAREVAGKSKYPLLPHAIRKIRETGPQAMLKRDQRLRNLRGAFAADESVRGLRLILVDDVMTTGATANECSKALLTAGAKEVFVMTLARAGL